MMRSSTLCSALLLTLAFCALESRPASAQLCFFSITGTINFGNIDVTANGMPTASGTLQATCIGATGRTVRICPNINTGTGNPLNGIPRGLANGANILNYNLYQDAGHGTVWGSHLWAYAATPPTVDLLLTSFIASTSRPIYARIDAGQQTLPAGLYTSSFAGAQTAVAYAYSTVGNCAAIGTTNSTQVGFSVRATVTPTCRVTASPLNFGTVAILNSNVDVTGSADVTCTNATPYQVRLNDGLTGTGPTNRRMTLGAGEVVYGLYRDAARSLPWGNTAGVNSLPGTGSGLAQSLPIYGRVPPQTTPASGTYSDTVIISVTY